MVTCMGSDLLVVGCLFFKASVAGVILEVISGCLELSVSCMGVRPGGSCWRKVCSRVCHLARRNGCRLSVVFGKFICK